MTQSSRLSTGCGLALLGALAFCRLLEGGGPAPDKPKRHRPVAIALADGGRLLVAADQAAGVLVAVDVASGRIASQATVGVRLSDLASLPDGRLLVVDEQANTLSVVLVDGDSFKLQHKVAVSADPISVRPLADGRGCCVTSRWSRQVSIFDVPADAPPKLRHTVDLPFAPRCLLPVAAKIVVADAFGGALAVVDADSGKLESVRTLNAHNIRGLAASHGELLIAHQTLDARTHTTAEEIHWGNVVGNSLRTLSLAAVLNPQADLLKGSRLRELGSVGRGAGDPAGVAVRADGMIIVSLGGVGELTFGKDDENAWKRVACGRRPTALVLSPDGRRAYVADALEGSLVVLDLETAKVASTVVLGTPTALTSEEKGERLFYDARLSNEGWMSCHSCHTDGHSNGRLSDTLSDGGYGASKRVLSLLGVGATGPWTWIGHSATLEGQVRDSVKKTMRGRSFSDEQAGDLTAFLRTLAPPPPVRAPKRAAEIDAIARGKAVFEKRGCVDCHAPPTFTSAKTYDVGLVDDQENTRFNPPSLRGVGQGGPYLHDGRAATLDEVFTRVRHQTPDGLPPAERDDLLSFLRSL